MMVTDKQVEAAIAVWPHEWEAHNLPLDMRRALEAAAKVAEGEGEPVAYASKHQLIKLERGEFGIVRPEKHAVFDVPVYLRPSPREAELERALREARRWVEANTAQVRGLSAEAAAPGEEMLKRIGALLSPQDGAGK